MKTAFQRQSKLALLIGLVAVSCLSAASGARGQGNGKGEIKTISLRLVSEISRSSVEAIFETSRAI